MVRTSQHARKTSPLNLPGAFELFKPSKDIVLKNIWIFGPLYGVSLLIGLINWSLTPADSNSLFNQQVGIGGDSPSASVLSFSGFFIGIPIIWTIIAILIGFIIQIMAQKAQLDGSENKPLGFDKMWATVRELGLRLVGLYIVVGIITVVGFILLIIPGIIMLRRYSMAPYIMIEKKFGIRESMDASAAITKPYSRSIYSIIGVMVLIAIAVVIPVIGWLISLILGMLYSVALALRYQQLKKLA